MAMGRDVFDRRREPREWAAGLINWKKETGRQSFWGLLSDDSAGSVSFVTQTRYEPDLGEDVEVIRSGQPEHHYRVARITPYDHTLSLIACADTHH
ncbi:MAG: hypothetical protein ABII12_16595 [Planctomycetota bacterium]